MGQVFLVSNIPSCNAQMFGTCNYHEHIGQDLVHFLSIEYAYDGVFVGYAF
jgi:hypothetical protein